MKRHLVILAFTVLSATYCFGQNSNPQENVSYDPSFWAQELRLDAEQRNKIEAINAEFYELLKSRPSMAQLQSYLEEREGLILETFHGRQKRKWEKIVSTIRS